MSVALAPGYLLWRACATVGGADPLAAGILLVAEALGALGFAARARSARTPPVAVRLAPDAPHPDTAAVVDATRASVGELRTTLLSLRRVEGVERVVVVAPGASWAARSVVERLGASLAPDGVGVDAAVRGASSGWVLVARAGDLPMPDLVTVCAARCSAPDVAVVQVGIEEADPTSFEHDPDGWWSPVPFDQEVVRPSLAARGSLPWYGDGPALVRRAALAAVAPTPDGRLLDDTRRVGLDLVRAGFAVTMVPVTLSRVRGPFGLTDSLQRRRHRLRAALRHLTPRDLGGIPRPALVAHLLSVLPTLVAVQRVLLAVVALLVLVAGQTPLGVDPVVLVAVAAPVYGIRAAAVLALGRGRLRPRTLWRSELRSLGVDLLAFLPSRGRGAGVWVLAGLVTALAAAVVWASVAWWNGWPGRAPADVTILTMAAVAVFLVVSLEVLVDTLARRQRRHQHRVRLGLVTCRIEDHDGQLVDLSTGGAGVVIVAPADVAPPVGEVTTVAFRIPDADGAWRNVTTLARVAHRRPDPDGGVHLGLAFDEPTDAPLDPVVEFLTIDRRLVALGRHEHASG